MKWLEAARKGDLAELRRQLNAGQDVNATGGKGRTALHAASEGGDAAAVKLLLKAAADPNAFAHGIGRPLTAAVQKGHWEVAAALLAGGADPNHGGVAYIVVSEKRIDLLEAMLRRGLDPNGRESLLGTYLSVAVESAYYEKVQGPHGPALQTASKNVKPDTRCLDALLAAGGDIARAEAADGESFLRTPLFVGDEKMIRRLIEAGAKPPGDQPKVTRRDSLAEQPFDSRRGTLHAFCYDTWQTAGLDVGDDTRGLDAVCEALGQSSKVGVVQRDITEAALAGKLDQPVAPHPLILKLKRHRWALVHASGRGSTADVAEQLAREAKRPAIWCGHEDTSGATAFQLYDNKGKLRTEFESTGEDYRAASKDDLDRVECRTTFKSDSYDRKFWKQHADENETLQALVREQDAYLPVVGLGAAKGKLKLQSFPEDTIKPQNVERIVLAIYGPPAAAKPSDVSMRLRQAISKDDVQAAREAIAAGASLQFLPGLKCSPLGLAVARAQNGQPQRLEMIRALLAAGANPNAAGTDIPAIFEPFEMVIWDADKVIAVLDVLLAAGADINLHAPRSMEGSTLLHLAGDGSLVQYFLTTAPTCMLSTTRARRRWTGPRRC